MTAPPTAPPRMGVVLSGGGVRGLAHLGVLQALSEAGIEFDAFSGVSAGALVAVLAAAECSPDDALDFWLESEPFKRTFAAGALEPGLFDSREYVQLLRERTGCDHFEDLPRELCVAVTSMRSGKVRYVNEGPLWPVVVASAAYPIIFTPVSFGEDLLMDGGIGDNFPAKGLPANIDIRVGVNVSPCVELGVDVDLASSAILERIIEIKFGVTEQMASAQVDVLITPTGIGGYGVFDREYALEILRLGKQAGRAAVHDVRAKIDAFGSQS